jgi:actin-related protein
VQREEATANSKEKDDTTVGSSSTSQRSSRPYRSPIVDIRYDYYNRPIQSDGTDGTWEVANPVDPVTGLWYDPNNHSTSGGADWYDLLQHMLQHGYDSAMQHSPMDKHPLLLVERSYNPPAIRQQVLELLFEEMHVPAVFLAKDAVLACYACGRTTGTVVDMGYSGTTVTPVYEGYVEQAGIRRSPTGVKQVDTLILEQLEKLHTAGPIQPRYQVRNEKMGETSATATASTSATSKAVPRRQDAIHLAALLQVAQECREMGAGAAVNTTGNGATFSVPHKSFELPDGTVVDVPSANRFAAADLILGGSSGDNNENTKRREKLLEEHRQQLGTYIATAEVAEEENENDEGEGGADKDDAMDTTDEKYSESAAAGISKRRTKQGSGGSGGSGSKSSKKAATSTNKAFSNRHLQKACASYLQTLQSDQLTSSPVASMICDAAYRCDRDQQAALLGNVVLTGGGACMGPTEQAVPDFLREQVEAIIHTHTPGWRVKVLAPGMQERSVGSWLGGSILGSLGTFHDMWITKAEYEEWGSAIVNRKCP